MTLPSVTPQRMLLLAPLALALTLALTLLATRPSGSADHAPAIVLLCNSPLIQTEKGRVQQGRGDDQICETLADAFLDELAMVQHSDGAEQSVEFELVWGRDAVSRLVTATKTGVQRYDVWLGGEPELHWTAEKEGLVEATDEIFLSSGRLHVSVIRDSRNYKTAYYFLDWVRQVLEQREREFLG